MLQQHLPFTVLKRNSHICHTETSEGCNSTYRLRYAPQSVRQQRSKATMRPTHCKCLNEVKVKQKGCTYCLQYWNYATVCSSVSYSLGCNSTYRLRYWNVCSGVSYSLVALTLHQCLPFTVCAEGCEAAEVQSDDEIHTLQVLNEVKVKRKWYRNSAYRLRYWNAFSKYSNTSSLLRLQQRLPFTVCAAECEAAEE